MVCIHSQSVISLQSSQTTNLFCIGSPPRGLSFHHLMSFCQLQYNSTDMPHQQIPSNCLFQKGTRSMQLSVHQSCTERGLGCIFISVIGVRAMLEAFRWLFLCQLCQLRKPNIVFRDSAERSWLESGWSILLSFSGLPVITA